MKKRKISKVIKKEFKKDLDNLKDKTILLINAGSVKKRFILKKINQLGPKVILLNRKKEAWAEKYVDHWILADNNNFEESIQAVKEFIASHQKIKIDGVVTFWEDDVLLTSRIIDRFHFIGIPFNIAKNARNKYLFRDFCYKNNIPAPKYTYIRSEKDIKKIIREFNFPLVIKPAFGSSSAYVIKIENVEDLRNSYKFIKKSISTEIESALRNGLDILVEEYIDGDEVDIDMLLQNGRIKFQAISDNTKTKEPFFVETDRLTPSQLPEDDQKLLLEMADYILEKMNVQNGCIHLEAKFLKGRGIPIEVNLRMGGDEIYSSTKEAWGVDLIENALKIACGIYIPKQKSENPRQYLIARTLMPDFSGVLSKLEIDPRIEKNKYVKEFQFFKKVGDSVLVPPEGYEYFGWLMVSGDNYLDASDNLEEVIKYIECEVAKFDPESSIGTTSGKKPISLSRLYKGTTIANFSKIEKIRKIDLKDQKNLYIGIAGNFSSNGSEKNAGDYVERVLKERGYKTAIFDFDNVRKVINELERSNVDFIFNACEKVNNQDVLEPHAASLFDLLKIPYTGSSPFTLASCMDKIKAKKLLDFHKISTPAWDYLYDLNDEIRKDLEYPLIVKPSNTSNLVAISDECIVINEKQLKAQLEKIIKKLARPAIIEEFIEGDEYDVSILGMKNDGLNILPLCRSVFDKLPKNHWHIYSSENKLKGAATNSLIKKQIPPKKISKNLQALIIEMALDTYNIFDCHDYGRTEIRLDKNNNPYVLGLSPNPSLNENDILPMSAKVAGFDYGDLIEEIIGIAIKRYKEKPIYNHLSF